MQLVINTFGASLRKHGEQFVVSAGDKKVTLSAHKVQSILLATAVHLTTDAIELAVSHNVDLIFLGKEGDPIARVWQTRMGSTAVIRRRQLEVSAGPEGLVLARSWVDAKLRHQAEFLEELRQRRPEAQAVFESPLATIAASRAGIERLEGTLDEQRGSLMGLEGSAGRAYFTCLGQLMPESYRFNGRSRQPALDGFNAMLNYSYGVLYGLIERACICAGLDPHVGFVHVDNYGKPSLVFDLIEPFRILGERATVLLFTGRRARADFFEEVPGGVALSKEGRAFFLAHYNERLDKGVRYPVQGAPGRSRNIKQRDVIQFEAHALANILLGRRDLPRIVETRQLWKEEAPISLEEEPGDESGPDEPIPPSVVEDEPC